ncbi:MAG: exosome protein [Pyrobaculum sp.]|nr:exosome protein [Pyrobaculum sp.]
MRCRFMEISVVIHATESLERVFDALRRFFGEIPLVVEIYEGHHGNPIYLVTSFLNNCDGVLAKLCNAFGGRIPASEGESKDLYYLRLDKQALARGVVKAAEQQDDVVRLRIRVRDGLCG